ncbi:MAG: RsmB/NOP family class I SAM-dependent RNA methyltransferase, partial [Candidatus Omnitrophica bacterium]|nr:RsmB/NOP family class I SAM-dependent RNA methyltransferase [Candidatus Omnitrophota bacterium]
MASTTDNVITLPEEFLQRLGQIIPQAQLAGVLSTFSVPKPISFRINALHNRADVLADMAGIGCEIEEVPWYADAYVLTDRERAGDLEDLIAQGKIYRQGLSSMLAALILDPRPGEAVLDACAAPGSKTSLIAALMNNTGRIVAVERVKSRLYKLQAVLKQQGVTNVRSVLADIRRYRAEEGLFDRVLVDAPCSSEGRFQTFNKRSVNYWSLRKIREMVRKQRGIINSAARLLRPGGTLVYATCT